MNKWLVNKMCKKLQKAINKATQNQCNETRVLGICAMCLTLYFLLRMLDLGNPRYIVKAKEFQH